MFARGLVCAAILAAISSSAAAEILLTSDLVVDAATPDFGGFEGDAVYIENGATVEVIGDNEMLRKYRWDVYDGQLNYHAGEGLRVFSPGNSFLMTGGQAAVVVGRGTIVGGRVERFAVDDNAAISGDAVIVSMTGAESYGLIEISGGTILEPVGASQTLRMTGGTVHGINVIRNGESDGNILDLRGGNVQGLLRASFGGAIYVSGSSLAFDGNRLTGILDDGTPIDTLVDVSQEGSLFMDNFPHVAGDANDDDQVDLQDLNAVRNHFGESGFSGDVDRDGVIGLGDLNLVRNAFGQSVGQPVPEPASAILLLIGLQAWHGRKRAGGKGPRCSANPAWGRAGGR